jgi:hypothetical protein
MTTAKNVIDSEQHNIDLDVNDDEINFLQQQQQKPQHDYKFITNRMCPYAQKVWMALEVLEIPYTMIEIPLYGNDGKPD